MGAQSFSIFVAGSDATACFRQARDEAKFDRGHGGYTGTIGEKGGFVMRKKGAPLPMWEAEKFVEEDMEQNDKWGPAFCLPVVDVVTLEETAHTREVEAPDHWEAGRIAQAQLMAEYPDGPEYHYASHWNGMAQPISAGDGRAATTVAVENGARYYRAVPAGFQARGGGTFSGDYPVGPDPEGLVEKLRGDRRHSPWVPGRDPGAPQAFEIQEVRTVQTVTVAPAGALPRWRVQLRLRRQTATGASGFLFYSYASS